MAKRNEKRMECSNTWLCRHRGTGLQKRRNFKEYDIGEIDAACSSEYSEVNRGKPKLNTNFDVTSSAGYSES